LDNERKNEITKFANRASFKIIDLAQKKAVKRGFGGRKISKIEAGDRIAGKDIFWVKICERQRTEKPSDRIEFFEDVWVDGYLWPFYIRVTF